MRVDVPVCLCVCIFRKDRKLSDNAVKRRSRESGGVDESGRRKPDERERRRRRKPDTKMSSRRKKSPSVLCAQARVPMPLETATPSNKTLDHPLALATLRGELPKPHASRLLSRPDHLLRPKGENSHHDRMPVPRDTSRQFPALT